MLRVVNNSLLLIMVMIFLMLETPITHSSNESEILQSYSVIKIGVTYESGDHTRTHLSDNQYHYWKIYSYNGYIEYRFNSSLALDYELVELEYVTEFYRAGGDKTDVQIYNWKTMKWEILWDNLYQTHETVYNKTLTESPWNYVNGNTGEIRIRYYYDSYHTYGYIRDEVDYQAVEIRVDKSKPSQSPKEPHSEVVYAKIGEKIGLSYEKGDYTRTYLSDNKYHYWKIYSYYGYVEYVFEPEYNHELVKLEYVTEFYRSGGDKTDVQIYNWRTMKWDTIWNDLYPRHETVYTWETNSIDYIGCGRVRIRYYYDSKKYYKYIKDKIDYQHLKFYFDTTKPRSRMGYSENAKAYCNSVVKEGVSYEKGDYTKTHSSDNKYHYWKIKNYYGYLEYTVETGYNDTVKKLEYMTEFYRSGGDKTDVQIYNWKTAKWETLWNDLDQTHETVYSWETNPSDYLSPQGSLRIRYYYDSKEYYKYIIDKIDYQHTRIWFNESCAIPCTLNSEPCLDDYDCCSGHCAEDYDGSGKWCEPSTSCAHDGVEYPNGTDAPDCCDPYNKRYCNSGFWNCAPDCHSVPTSIITAPDPGSWHVTDFPVYVDDHAQAGLDYCQYRVSNNGIETRSFTNRTCNSSVMITVGEGKDCRDQGVNKCTVYVRAIDKLGNVGEEDSRSFSVDWTPEHWEIDVTLTLSETSVEYGDVIYADLSGILTYLPTGESFSCNNACSVSIEIDGDQTGKTYFEQFKQNYEETYGDWDQYDFWDPEYEKWVEIPIETELYHSTVKMTLEFLGLISGSDAKDFNVKNVPTCYDFTRICKEYNEDEWYPYRDHCCEMVNRYFACESDPTDTACCADDNCVFNSECYSPGNKEDVDLDGYLELCVAGSNGEWTETSEAIPSDIEIRITYPAIESLLIPIDGTPLFTKPMPIEFLARAFIKATGKECSDCSVYYSIDGSGQEELEWDEFSRAFAGSLPSKDLDCDQEYTLIVKAEKNGLYGMKSSRFFVSCEPMITVNPMEKRLVLGDSDLIIFNVTIWNPLEANEYELLMKPDPEQNYLLSWIKFDCNGNPNCEVDPENDDKAVLDIPELGSGSVLVHLDSANRVGVYPIEFKSGIYKGKGTLMIFAEALPEFALWQLIALILISSVLFGFVKKVKQ